jgi:hypothetical protein
MRLRKSSSPIPHDGGAHSAPARSGAARLRLSMNHMTSYGEVSPERARARAREGGGIGPPRATEPGSGAEPR